MYRSSLDSRNSNVIKSRICPECLNDLDQEYIEEGDDRLCIEPIKCPYCGWELRDGWVGEEVPYPPSGTENPKARIVAENQPGGKEEPNKNV